MRDARQFQSIYQHGFARVAACTLRCALADPARNADTILALTRRCHNAGVAVAVFPELSLSGYLIEDLLFQDTLLDAVQEALATLLHASRELLPLVVIGAPLAHGNRLFNTAAVMHRGRLLGVVPKSYLPNYREFYEPRHFAPGSTAPCDTISLAGHTAPFGADLLFVAEDLPALVTHVEICEDVWMPVPPSSMASLAGATVLVNPSASPITVGKAETRSLLCRSQSARCLAAYVYAAAGAGESTTDLAWDGQADIYENGALLAQTDRFPDAERIAMADIDLDALRQERLRMTTFDENRAAQGAALNFRRIGFTLDAPMHDFGLRRTVERFPFVPNDASRLQQDCFEAYNIQVAGLKQRLVATAIKRVVIGVSGGLDSTQALIVAAKAFDLLRLPRADILAFTMPGFGTSDQTKRQAHALIDTLGVTGRELDIRPAAELMLAGIGHPYARGERGREVYDLTFENVQAGLRTDYLFRLANQHGGLVVGTGDLSELALGWCTYGVGDQMSHYNVNAGVPKTLIQHLIRWAINSRQFEEAVGATMRAILATEISPELIPADASGAMQSTESMIGPYALQDFNLFYVLRCGFRPAKIAFLAWHAWRDAEHGAWPPGYPDGMRRSYTLKDIRHWLHVFLARYFGFSQFKRSAMPNGPKVVAGGSLSPRGDWRAPSDGNANAWLAQLEAEVPVNAD